MFALEWREIAIVSCVAAFWIIVFHRLLLGLRVKHSRDESSP
jgi:hypothetical protein